MLKGFLLNDQLIKCNERTCKPDLPKNHVGQKKTCISNCEEEKQVLERVKNDQFNELNSISYNWLKQLFSESNIRYEKVRAICEILAYLLNEKLTREIYRRRISCVYWMEQNIQKIYAVLRANTLIALSEGKVVNILPPDMSSKNKNKETSVVTGVQSECFDFFFESEEEEPIFMFENMGDLRSF